MNFEMNSVQKIPPEVFGLFELSDEGTVLYSRSAAAQSAQPSPEIVGRNFFDEVAPFENTEEFRRYVERFIQSDFPSESFNFTCQIKNENIPAKIMLVRIIERSSERRAKTTIVDIRKA